MYITLYDILKNMIIYNVYLDRCDLPAPVCGKKWEHYN